MTTAHLWLVGVMLSAGFLGGSANHLTRGESADDRVCYLANLLVSVLAAFVTPLFLSLAKSTLLDQLIAGGQEGKSFGADIFVFLGFCLIASFSARVFVRNLTETVLNLTRSQQRLKEQVKDLEGDVSEIGGEVEPPVAEEEREPTRRPEPGEFVPVAKLTPNQRHMLQALVNRPFTWRSVAGVRKEVGLSRETAADVLDELVQAQLADKKPSKSGGWLYRIAAEGRSALGLQPLLG